MSDASRRGWALGLIATAQFMVIMDTSIIGVALPRIQEDLGFTPGNLSWVFNAYVVAFAGLLLLGGRLADLFGARRVFTIGWVVLLVGSAVAGAAGNVAVELTGRVVQGAGAALVAPAALTLLMSIFGSTPRELTRALAVYGAAAPAGGTAGVFLGGLITEYASWPWVFWINVPIAVLVLAVTRALLPPGATARGSVDAVGALLVTVGLGALVFAVVRAPEVGWGTAQTWLVLGAAVALLVAFVVTQARRRDPLVPLRIFRTPNLGAANLAQALLGAAWVAMWFYLNLYLQQVLGLGAFASGAALVPDDGARHGRHGGARTAADRPLGHQGAHRGRPARPRRRSRVAVVRPPRRRVRRGRPPGHARGGARHVPRVHPVARHRHLERTAAGRRARVGHRQHELPGRVRAGPRGDDRCRGGVRRDRERGRRRAHGRVLRGVPRRGGRRAPRRAPRRDPAAHARAVRG